MAEQELLLKEHSLTNIAYLEQQIIKYEQNIADFLSSKVKKCLLVETKDSRAEIWRIIEMILNNPELNLNNPLSLKLSELVLTTDSSYALPRFPKLALIEIDNGDLVSEHLNLLKKIIDRLNLNNDRKLIFVISEIDLLDHFLYRMKPGTFLKMLEGSHNLTGKLESFEGDSLFNAAACGGADVIMKLHKAGFNINKFDRESGNSALHVAAERGHTEAILTLIKLNSYITTNLDGFTPIDLAAFWGHEDGVVALLENCLDTDKFEWTALHQAAKRGNTNIVKILIEYGTDVNVQDERGYSALHYAVKYCHYIAAYILIQNGANVNAENKHRCTPLHFAAGYGYGDIAKALLDKEAWIDPSNEEGKTPMDLAKEAGHQQIVELLDDRLHERYVLRQAINIIRRRSSVTSINNY